MTAEEGATAEVTVRRLCNLDDWEFYEVCLPGESQTGMTVSLRPFWEFHQVEYEVWNDGTDEPIRTGSIPSDDVSELWLSTPKYDLVRIVALAEEPQSCTS